MSEHKLCWACGRVEDPTQRAQCAEDRARQDRATATRLAAWSTSNGCPTDCDRTYSGDGHQGSWSSDHDGRCRHGAYVGGSGADYMCGTCEDYGQDEEIAILRGERQP